MTRAVTAQYEGWPYPAWTRITVGETEATAGRDPSNGSRSIAKALPVEANMLIAGCGTGRQAASVGLRYPDATVTAIDVSEASLDYARRQCATLGVANVRFVKLDLHDVADLNQRFPRHPLRRSAPPSARSRTRLKTSSPTFCSRAAS